LLTARASVAEPQVRLPGGKNLICRASRFRVQTGDGGHALSCEFRFPISRSAFQETICVAGGFAYDDGIARHATKAQAPVRLVSRRETDRFRELKGL
jgi:hypothetical protein